MTNKNYDAFKSRNQNPSTNLTKLKENKNLRGSGPELLQKRQSKSSYKDQGFLGKLKQKASDVLAAALKSGPVFDPSVFNDPLAERIEWCPNQSGGSNFCTHRLQIVDQHNANFKITAGAYFFGGIFFAVGLFVCIGGIIGIASQIIKGLSLSNPETYSLLIMPLFGLPFMLVGGFLIKTMRTPRVFDLVSGYYYYGKSDPMDSQAKTNIEQCRIRDIHAIQLIRESVSGKNSSFYSYELNLVQKNGERITVVDHGSKEKIKEDADKLSRFLQIPLWSTL